MVVPNKTIHEVTRSVLCVRFRVISWIVPANPQKHTKRTYDITQRMRDSTKLRPFRHNPFMSELSENVVLDALRQIKDPDLHKDIVTLGFIKDLKIDGGDISFRIVLTTPACPVKAEMESAARELVGALPGVTSVAVTMDAEVPKGRGLGDKIAIEGVRNI